MDELKGPTIQIVLNVKEGLGFGFLKSPFVVSGSLNGYILETDPVVPGHAPVFDAELVWEADKRRFRSLRVQNVPVKVEVFTHHTEGKKEKVGYLLLSLLGAQPCPASRNVDIKHTWHRLLGVKSEGKCCHPQLLMSLSVEDRINTPTPRNDLRLFHCNETAYPSVHDHVSSRPMLLTYEEYIGESKRTVSTPELQPKLICDEGLIQIGDGNDYFILGIVIGSVENIDLLLPSSERQSDTQVAVSYTVFTHNITTDSVSVKRSAAAVNVRTSLRLRSSLPHLARYLADCPHLVVTVRTQDSDIGICSLDLRKLIPSDDVTDFTKFCDRDKTLTIHERCFLMRVHSGSESSRRPYIDVDLSLQYMAGKAVAQKCTVKSARSATQLRSDRGAADVRTSGSHTHLPAADNMTANTNILSDTNTNRYTNAAGDAIQTSEIADMIRKMYESFTTSRKLEVPRPVNVEIQVEPVVVEEPVKLTRSTTNSTKCVGNDESVEVKTTLPQEERVALMQKYVAELEDWKEKQQELFKCQLKRKEDYHLELLSLEWNKRRVELERQLRTSVERCQDLAAELSEATEDFRQKGHKNAEREKKLLEAKKTLEAHFTAKYQELREASLKMQDDMNHRLRLKDMTIEELQMRVQQLEKQIDGLQSSLKEAEKDAERRVSGLSKEQTASLVQELRCMEEKLESAIQSKAFFKEQWGRAVRELHLVKLDTRARLLRELRASRASGLNITKDQDENLMNKNLSSALRINDESYLDIMTKTSEIDAHSVTGAAYPIDIDDNLETYDTKLTTSKSRLEELIAERDKLVQDDSPDEATIKQLNHDIRSILMSYGT
ncbi:centrosomal protein of 120 kDa-like [Aricia agestis]|uniref:centrosomal protein of 120 kDa-like n=1 Tax=Aricia agestis TaxID=91739 RepID=UPI001C204E47|nr:centrosomal protein of 120 kDa-like [Aricia agestis]